MHPHLVAPAFQLATPVSLARAPRPALRCSTSASTFLAPLPLSPPRPVISPPRPPRPAACAPSPADNAPAAPSHTVSSSSSSSSAQSTVSTSAAHVASTDLARLQRAKHIRTHPVIKVATARAITPVRRPRDENAQRFMEQQQQQQPMPAQRRTDLMAPKTTGIWALIPYVAASAVLIGLSWIAKKRFTARQERLVEEFGDVLVVYGTSPDLMREITSDYKRRVGPAILRQAMFSSYLRAFVSEKAIVPSTIQDVGIIKRLLGLNDDRAITAINALAASLQDAPSLLGKLLFLGERMVVPEKVSKLNVVTHFPYSESTVAALQQNMLERCYKEFVEEEIEESAIEEPPMAAAAALRIDAPDAQVMFDDVVLARVKRREEEAARIAAEAAEQATKPDIAELDSPARSAEPTKAAVHAYQCSDCGYTLYPAAGREFKFYGDDFVCPACGAPKDKFVDLNEDE